jgi:hypothetical protein
VYRKIPSSIIAALLRGIIKLPIAFQPVMSPTGTTDQELAAAFRSHLPDLTSPRFTTSAQQSPYEYTEAFQNNHAPPWLYNLTEAWKELLKEPYKDITVDGRSIPLFGRTSLPLDAKLVV